MRRIKAGVVNSISFIKTINYTTNSFDVQFEKLVGTRSLSLTDIPDNHNLADCNDFISLNIDLVSNTLEGGEYYMTVTNGGSSITVLCEVESYTTTQGGAGIYGDTVKFTDL